MRLLSGILLLSIVVGTGCQSTGTSDGLKPGQTSADRTSAKLAGPTYAILSGLPQSAYQTFREYENLPDFKVMVLSRHVENPGEWGRTKVCSARASASEALRCAMKGCKQNRKNSENPAQYRKCTPYLIGDELVRGKDRAEITSIVKKYNKVISEKAQSGARVSAEIKKVSLEEAKEIAAEFEQNTYVAPPRTIEDITSILDKQKLSNPAALSKTIERAHAPEPKGASARTLAMFYFNRGRAAANLGLTRQAISDFRGALDHLVKTNYTAPRALRIQRSVGSIELGLGNYKRAIGIFRQALETPGEDELATFLSQSKLIEAYLKMGDFETARKIRTKSDSYTSSLLENTGFLTAKPNYKPLLLRERSAQNAIFLTAQGFHQKAERHIKEFIKHHQDLQKVYPDAPFHPPLVWKGKLAKNLKKQGQLLQAEVAAREALIGMLQKAGKYNIRSARLTLDLAIILEGQNRNQEALHLRKAAVEILQSIKIPEQSSLLGEAQFSVASSMAWLEDWAGAALKYETVRRDSAVHEATVEKWIRDSHIYFLTLIKTGQTQRAVTELRRQLQRDQNIMPHKRKRIAIKQGYLALAVSKLGKRDEALKIFQQSIPVLISKHNADLSGGSSVTKTNLHMVNIVNAYLTLLTSATAGSAEGAATGNDGKDLQDIAEKTFSLAEIARSQSVQSALTASGVRAAAGDQELASLVRRLQDVGRQQNAVSGLLGNVLSVPTDQQDAVATANLRDNLNRLQSAQATLKQEINNRFPEYANLIAPKPPSIDDVQKQLRGNEVLVSFYISEENTYVWAVPKFGPIGFQVTDLGRDDIERLVFHLRAAVDPGAVARIGDIPLFDVRAAYGLYEKLLKPLETIWEHANSLIIVTDGALGQLPLSVLPTKPHNLSKDDSLLFGAYRSVPWLAQTHSVTVLPSASSLSALRTARLPSSNRRSFAGFGDPYFNKPQHVAALAALQPASTKTVPIQTAALRNLPDTRGTESITIENLPRLPDTRSEIEDIARALKAIPSRDVFLGERASEDIVKSLDLSRYKIISFATHGLVAGDLNGLTQPALALSSPSVTKGKEDGLLTMKEILGLKLNADWAVLSACNTAAADGKGAEAISGLGRAFFYAGTRALLVSNWPVHSKATTLLMTTLFNLQAENIDLPRTEALRRTRLNIINEGTADIQGKEAFSYAHPIFWAPFTIVGDGGGSAVGS
jgi:CHAT domain-containing protein